MPVGTIPTSTGSIAPAPVRNSDCVVIMGRVSRSGRSRAWRRAGDLVEIRRAAQGSGSPVPGHRAWSQLVEPEMVRELEHGPRPVVGRVARERVVAAVLEPPVSTGAREAVVVHAVHDRETARLRLVAE